MKTHAPTASATAIQPVLDPSFEPAILWNRAYRAQVAASGAARPVTIALLRTDETCFRFALEVLPATPEHAPLTLRYLERLLKFLFWQCGAPQVLIAGCDEVASALGAIYSSSGERAFDYEWLGEKIYGQALEIRAVEAEAIPPARVASAALGRHLNGCRIGFDLGGSDRKCAAVIDGTVVFTEEVKWNPYFEPDPGYHLDGINDSLRRAAAQLPRVDAIGGSAAGVYVDNEVRAASLFRGVPDDLFASKVQPMFHELQAEWNNVPFVVVNDGDVAALAGAMSLKENAVLGIAMGTSLAAGYVGPDGNLMPWLNELAFAPVDYRADAPADEWSGDRGCGVNYFSQQAVGRLAPVAGLSFADDMPLPEQLEAVQVKMQAGDERAARIYETIGTCLGYTIAHYCEHYELQHLLLLGRVTSGEGGSAVIDAAKHVLGELFPDLAGQVALRQPDETDKRHGQAMAAASLPVLSGEREGV